MWWHQRLAIVPGFARYLQAFDPRHEVPPVDLLPAKFRRAIPYLYSEAEIEALMHAARGIRSPLKAATYETLIGLLSVTGMRIGEAVALDRDDVELSERTAHRAPWQERTLPRGRASPEHGHGARRATPASATSCARARRTRASSSQTPAGD